MALVVPLGAVTVISTVPAAPAGAVAVIWVALLTRKRSPTLVPNFYRAVAPVRLVPVMATAVPPAVVPPVGVIALTVGAAAAT